MTGSSGPHQADFEETQAERGAVVAAEIAERLQQVLPGLAGRHHADPRTLGVVNNSVEAVGARIGECSGPLVLVEPLLLRDGRVKGARPEAAGRNGRPLRENDLRQVGPDVNRTAAFGEGASVTTFMPTQQPENRDIAIPCRPKSSSSCVLEG